MENTLKGNLVDIKGREIYPAEISIKDKKIEKITRLPKEEKLPGFIIPGFVDGHVHIESSMLIPSEFARLAVIQGTIATVSDPHEIGNVTGLEGVRFMVENGRKTPFKFYFGAPSCVPATEFETSGARIGAKEIEELLSMPEIKYLSEMMNFPGVLNKDPEVWAKLEAAKKYGKPVDGHAPGLRGEDAKKYCEAGISTDHECYSLEEAEEKLKYGMKVIIREGSSAKNFEELNPLITKYYENIMLCADDLHPNDLQKGHINQLVKRSIDKGHDLFNVLQIACFNPIDHYKLDLGKLREGDWADIVVLEDLKNFKVLTTYINGEKVAENGKSLIHSIIHNDAPLNNFKCTAKKPEDFKVPAKGPKINVIEAIDGSLLTKHHQLDAKIIDGHYVADLEHDLVKIAVVNRYKDAPVSVGFIKGFGIKGGAIACSIAHDSHNITTAGIKDEDIARVVNRIIEMKGGVAVLHENGELVSLNLPYGGLMSGEDAFYIAERYDVIEHEARKVSKMHAPFMTMAFMALLVIPEIKISDKGLFDGVNFKFIDLSTS